MSPMMKGMVCMAPPRESPLTAIFTGSNGMGTELRVSVISVPALPTPRPLSLPRIPYAFLRAANRR